MEREGEDTWQENNGDSVQIRFMYLRNAKQKCSREVRMSERDDESEVRAVIRQ
jgi:hypothetical protein